MSQSGRDYAPRWPEDFGLDAAAYAKLRPWYAALANRSRRAARVLMFGDSLVEGYALTAWADTYAAQLAAALRGRLGVTSSGLGFIGPQSAVGSHPFWPVTSANACGFGYGANDRFINLSAAGHKVTFTVPAGGVSGFDIIFYGSTTGNVAGAYYKIDGGAAVNIDTTVGVALTLKTVAVRAAANATVEFGWLAGGVVSFVGVVAYKGDESAGVQVHNCAMTGTTAVNWNTYANTGWAKAQALLAPDLIVINLGTNDNRVAAGNRTAAQWKSDMTTLIANVRAYIPAPTPIVLSMAYDASNDATADTWTNYVAAAKELALADPTLMVLDHSLRMTPSAASDPLDLYNDAALPHANAKGYGLMADTLAAALLPR